MKRLNQFMKHRTLFLLVLLVFFVLLSFLGCLFLYFYSNSRTISNATLIFSYSEDSSDLVVDSSMPVTDTIGKQLTYVPNQTKYAYSEFSLSSTLEGITSIDYEIYAVPVGVAMELPKDYIKVYLTDGRTDLPVDGYRDSIPTFRELKVAKTNPAGRKIYSGTLKKDEEKKFKLRLWLADTYPISAEMKDFKILLYVRTVD